ncbi:CytoDHC cytoplasmic dynein heavy chain [Giardia muris]|uniref:CytoDHC cytoplasmic dynein heavy chain n=1 Tax=Giardia muris TaxID=5742 RepID=A0A4Z1T0C6_GIAMU|nr:CytoDHC cytoplasmic dynein heavy chain [Giardia muris]|eukprot:TNJ26367.1 CytoDHC cytoplasmic dynein heavy chain [Giardia muris]
MESSAFTYLERVIILQSQADQKTVRAFLEREPAISSFLTGGTRHLFIEQNDGLHCSSEVSPGAILDVKEGQRPSCLLLLNTTQDSPLSCATVEAVSRMIQAINMTAESIPGFLLSLLTQVADSTSGETACQHDLSKVLRQCIDLFHRSFLLLQYECLPDVRLFTSNTIPDSMKSLLERYYDGASGPTTISLEALNNFLELFMTNLARVREELTKLEALSFTGFTLDSSAPFDPTSVIEQVHAVLMNYREYVRRKATLYDILRADYEKYSKDLESAFLICCNIARERALSREQEFKSFVDLWAKTVQDGFRYDNIHILVGACLDCNDEEAALVTEEGYKRLSTIKDVLDSFKYDWSDEMFSFLHFLHFHLFISVVRGLWAYVSTHEERTVDEDAGFLFRVAKQYSAVEPVLQGVKAVGTAIRSILRPVHAVQAVQADRQSYQEVRVDYLRRLSLLITELANNLLLKERLSSLLEAIPTIPQNLEEPISRLLHLVREYEKCPEPCHTPYLTHIAWLFCKDFFDPGPKPSGPDVWIVFNGLGSIPGVLAATEQYDQQFKCVLDDLLGENDVTNFVTHSGEYYSSFALVASCHSTTQKYLERLAARFADFIGAAIRAVPQTAAALPDKDKVYLASIERRLERTDQSMREDAVLCFLHPDTLMPDLRMAAERLLLQRGLVLPDELLALLLTHLGVQQKTRLTSFASSNENLLCQLNAFSERYEMSYELWLRLFLDSFYLDFAGLEARLVDRYVYRFEIHLGREAATPSLETPPVHLLQVCGSSFVLGIPRAAIAINMGASYGEVFLGRLSLCIPSREENVLSYYETLFAAITGVFLPAVTLFGELVSYASGHFGSGSRGLDDVDLSGYLVTPVVTFYSALASTPIFPSLGEDGITFYTLYAVAQSVRTPILPFYLALFHPDFWSMAAQVVRVAGTEELMDLEVDQAALTGQDSINLYSSTFRRHAMGLYSLAGQFEAVFGRVQAETTNIRGQLAALVSAPPESIDGILGCVFYSLDLLSANVPSYTVDANIIGAGETAACLGLLTHVSRILTAKAIFALLGLQERFGIPEAVDLGETDCVQFCHARYALTGYLNDLCANLTVSTDSAALTTAHLFNLIDRIINQFLGFRISISRRYIEVELPATIHDFIDSVLERSPDCCTTSELRLRTNMITLYRVVDTTRARALALSSQVHERVRWAASLTQNWTPTRISALKTAIASQPLLDRLQQWLDLLDTLHHRCNQVMNIGQTGIRLGPLTLQVPETTCATIRALRTTIARLIGNEATTCLTEELQTITETLRRLTVDAGQYKRDNLTWTQTTWLLQWLDAAAAMEKRYQSALPVFQAAQCSLTLESGTSQSLSRLMNVIYPQFVSQREVLHSDIVQTPDAANAVLESIEGEEQLIYEAANTAVRKVRDPNKLFPMNIFKLSFDLTPLQKALKEYQEQLEALKGDVEGLQATVRSFQSIFGITVTVRSGHLLGDLVVAQRAIETILEPGLRRLQELSDAFFAHTLLQSVVLTDATDLEAAVLRYTDSLTAALARMVQPVGEDADVQAIFRSSGWAQPSTLSQALKIHSRVAMTLAPYVRQMCTPALFHASHWTQVVQELGPVLQGSDFLTPQNIQAQLETYTTGAFFCHLFEYLGRIGFELTAEEGPLPASVGELTSILDGLLNTARARSAAFASLASVDALARCIPLQFVHRGESLLISNLTDVASQLETALVTIDDLAQTPFAQEIGSQLSAHKATLTATLGVSRQLAAVQTQKAQLAAVLEPNFHAIRRFIATTATRYEVIVSELANLYAHLSDTPTYQTTDNLVQLIAVSGGADALAQKLSAAKEVLEDVARALTLFIERQRYTSPRLFFLTDEGVLKVISALTLLVGSATGTTGPQRTPEFYDLEWGMSVIFPGVQHILLSSHSGPSNGDGVIRVIGISSAEGEQLLFEGDEAFVFLPVITRSDQAELAIHRFIHDLDCSMRLTIYRQALAALECLRAYVRTSNTPFEDSPIVEVMDRTVCQAFNVANHLFVTEELDAPGAGGIETLLHVERCLLLHLQRRYRGTYRLNYLLPEITFIVSVIEDSLAHDGKVHDTPFRIRYCLSRVPTDESGPIAEIYSPAIVVRLLSYEHVYGCNYVGSGPQLVQTPLTSSHYTQSLIGMSNQFFIGPMGPAGTGKTESTRQLATQLGRPCFIFNCDETFDYQSVARILVGAFLLGCIICFDEFNRLSLDNLSSTAMIITSLQRVLRESAHLEALRAVETDGDEAAAKCVDARARLHNELSALLSQVGGKAPSDVRVGPGFACFVTMNPDYAGRRTLPENIAILLRPIIMPRADMEQICEVLMLGMGLQTGRDLSRDLCQLLTLLEENLPASDLYDFGLRSARTALVAADLMIRNDQALRTRISEGDSAAERYVIAYGLQRSFTPRLSQAEYAIFERLLTKSFGSLNALTPMVQETELGGLSLTELLEKFVIEAADRLHLLPTASFVKKVLHFHSCLQISAGTIILGETGTAKTAVQEAYWVALQSLFSFAARSTATPPRQVHVLRETPTGLVSKVKLLGTMAEITREWTDSHLTRVLREVVAEVEVEGETPFSGPFQPMNHWPNAFFVFDADIDPEWIEGFNSVLDANRCLTLCSGERIAIPEAVRFVFETSTTRHTTLATISRCSISVHSSETVGLADVMIGTLRKRLFVIRPGVAQCVASLSRGGVRGGFGRRQVQLEPLLQTLVSAVAFDVYAGLSISTTGYTFNSFIQGSQSRFVACDTAGTRRSYVQHTRGTLLEQDKGMDLLRELRHRTPVDDIEIHSVLLRTLIYAVNAHSSACVVSFSHIRVIQTLLRLLEAAVDEAGAFLKGRVAAISMSLAASNTSLATMDPATLTSPQFVAELVNSSGLKYEMLILFFVRRFVSGLAWALASEFPVARRCVIAEYVRTTYITAFQERSSAPADDLELEGLAVSLYTHCPTATEVFAGIYETVAIHDAAALTVARSLARSVAKANVPETVSSLIASNVVASKLLLSTVGAPEPRDQSMDLSTVEAGDISFLSYICSIDSTYWLLNDPNSEELRDSFASSIQDSVSALGASAVMAEGRRLEVSASLSTQRAPARARQLEPVYHGGLIPNIDSQSFSHYIEAMIGTQGHVLLIGPVGSGKTMLLTHVLANKIGHSVCFLSFSATTSVCDLVNVLLSACVLTHEGDRHVLRLTSGRVLCLLIDEVNIVTTDGFETQPALEFLRFLTENSYFIYDGRLPGTGERRRAQDESVVIYVTFPIVLACSCNPPADVGRNLMSSRFMRHFAILYLDHPSHTALMSIYKTHVAEILGSLAVRYHDELALQEGVLGQLVEKLATGIVQVYERITRQLAKKESFYIYSPRDLTRWVSGIAASAHTYPLSDDGVFSVSRLGYLIYAEGFAVLASKLLRASERRLAHDILVEGLGPFILTLSRTLKTTATFASQYTDAPLLNVLWFQSHFPQLAAGTLSEVGFGKIARSVLLSSSDAEASLRLLLEASRKDVVSRTQLRALIVPLLQAVRCLNQTPGHMILDADPGLLPSSVIQFLSWATNCALIELRTSRAFLFDDFQAIIRDAIEQVVLRDGRVLLLISQDCGLETAYLEYLNNLLCNGEIPGLFTSEKLRELEGAAKGVGIPDLVKGRLHVLFKVSNTRSQNVGTLSPALYNRCQLISVPALTLADYVLEAEESFTEIEQLSDGALEESASALAVVLTTLPSQYSEALDVIADVSGGITLMERVCCAAAFMHCRVPLVLAAQSELAPLPLPSIIADDISLCSAVLASPVHFQRFLGLFVSEYPHRHVELVSRAEHLKKGLHIFELVGKIVTTLQEQLKEKQAELDTSAEETAVKLSEVTSLRERAMSRRSESMQISAEVAQKREYVRTRKTEIEAELAAVAPRLQEARQAVQNIDRRALNELRSLQRPTDTVRLVMEAVIIIIGTAKEIANLSWENIRRHMQRDEFHSSIVRYDPAAETHVVQRLGRLQQYIDNPKLSVEVVTRASLVAGQLMAWTCSIAEFFGIRSRMQPLEKDLERVNVEAADLERRNEEINAELTELQESIDTLSAECARCEARQVAVRQERDECERRATQASAVTTLLREEWELWTAQHAAYAEKLAALPGDVLLELFTRIYASGYNDDIRDALRVGMEGVLDSTGLPHMDQAPRLSSRQYVETVSSPTLFVVVLSYSQDDLEGLKETYDKHVVVSALDPNLMKTIERALKFGLAVFVENGDSFDTGLFALLDVTYSDDIPLVRLGTSPTQVQVHSNFRLFILCQRLDRALHFAARSAVVNFSQSTSSMCGLLVARVIQLLRPMLHSAHEHSRRELADCLRQREEGERRLLQILADVEENSVLNDPTILKSLQKAKEVCRQAKDREQLLIQQEAEYDSLHASLEAPCRVLAELYFVTSRLAERVTSFLFTVEQFFYIIDQTVKQAGETILQPHIFLQRVVSAFFTAIQQSLDRSTREAAYLAFLESIGSRGEQLGIDLSTIVLDRGIIEQYQPFDAYMKYYQGLGRPILVSVADGTDPNVFLLPWAEETHRIVIQVSYGSPDARLSQLAKTMAGVASKGPALLVLTNLHLAKMRYCEELIRIVADAQKTSQTLAVVFLLQSSKPTPLPPPVRSLCTALGCLSYYLQRSLQPGPLLDRMQLEMRRFFTQVLSEKRALLTQGSVALKLLDEMKESSDVDLLIWRLAYLYVIISIRGDAAPYGFTRDYGFTLVDAEYAVRLMIDELLRVGHIAVDTAFILTFRRLLSHVCFGNRVSSMHDAGLLGELIDRVLQTPKGSLPDGYASVFLNAEVEELLQKASARNAAELCSAILLRAQTSTSNAVVYSDPDIPMGALLEAIDIHPEALDQSAAFLADSYPRFADVLGSIHRNLVSTLQALAIAAKAEDRSAIKKAVGNVVSVRESVASLLNRLRYCTQLQRQLLADSLEPLRLSEFGTDVAQVIRALVLDLAKDTSIRTMTFTIMATSGSVPVEVFACMFDLVDTNTNGTTALARGTHRIILHMSVSDSPTTIGIPIFIYSNRQECVGYLRCMESASYSLQGCVGYFCE